MQATPLFDSAAIVLLSVLVAHWAPWNRLTGKELQPPWTYIIGAGCCVAPLLKWMDQCQAAGDLALVGVIVHFAAGGLGTVGAYLLDAWAASLVEKRLER